MSDTALQKIETLLNELHTAYQADIDSWHGKAVTAPALLKLIHARERALLAAIRADLPEPNKPHFLDDEGAKKFALGYNQSLSDVAAILTKYEEEK